MLSQKETVTHLYGFSYGSRHVKESHLVNMLSRRGPIFILEYCMDMEKEQVVMVIMHPLQLKELIDKKFDYWALGHIHKHTILHENPFIVYPGNIQGRNRKEIGEKGCYLSPNDREKQSLILSKRLILVGSMLDSIVRR